MSGVPSIVCVGKWPPGAALVVFLGLAAGPCHAQVAAQVSPRDWLGCWAVAMRDSVPYMARSLLLRLDSTRAPTRDGPQHYYGAGLEGFPPSGMRPNPLLWITPSPESLEVVVIGLGGIGWRFTRRADSLTGEAYEYYDIVPNETPRGPASARRQRCVP
jgi:hypothetical protein